MARKKQTAIWTKAGQQRLGYDEDVELCLIYCAGRDVAARPMADSVLVPYDVWTNLAHCTMLAKTGAMSPTRLRAIARALRRIEKDWKAGKFALNPNLEDVHMNIERRVARLAGESAAGVMHTARSRNDQTTTDIRLWMRDRLLDVAERLAEAIATLASLSQAHAHTVMAGWTHGQPAMPTTLGHWAAAHGAALARDLDALIIVWNTINISPLGAAAGFGSSWPIDRKLTARFQGFDRPQTNSLDCVSTRWECEARLGSALSIMMVHLTNLGQDLIRLSSPPLKQIGIDGAFTTGSSIMPQKRNPDFAEVTRARATAVQSLLGANASVARGALSGYNRDSQWSKYWIMDLLDEVGEAPRVFARVLETMTPDRKALARSADEDFVVAVDLADHIARTRGVEFRRVYHLIGGAVAADESEGKFLASTLERLMKRAKIEPPLDAAEFKEVTNARRAIKGRQSLGSPNPEDVKLQARALKARAGAGLRWVDTRRRALDRARIGLNRTIASMS